jgi:two-component sensor histidine kinase
MRVLIIDDNPDDRELERRQVIEVFPDAEIAEFTEASPFERALGPDAPEPALVVTDYQLKWSNGIDILTRSKARFPDCPVVMFTASGDEEIAVAAMKAGLDDYVVKSARHFGQFRSSIRGVVENARNRVALRSTEAQLRAALRQKELLLQELNHRTKNNLLTVMSLMRLRARRTDNEETREQLLELAGRVQSLAQVQSRILEADDLDQVDFGAYLADIAAALHRMYGNAHIALRFDMSGQLLLPVHRAGPLALLCYEVILNSFKHAFPDGVSGEVFIRAEADAETPIIEILDDGVGLSQPKDDRTLGMTLITELAEEADAEVKSERREPRGTRILIRLIAGTGDA